MSLLAILLAVGLGICLLTFVMTVINMLVLKRTPAGDASELTPFKISVCVPARDEEVNVEGVAASVLSQELAQGTTLELVFYDDQSTDQTTSLIEALETQDHRVRRAPTEPMPAGWSGKMWACNMLSKAATGDWLLFIDADVRLEPGSIEKLRAQAARLAQKNTGGGLLSCFPRQITKTLPEQLTVPMIFFILLSYLPFPRMRNTDDPAASAGCGQFLCVSREAYDAAAGHAAINNTMHDGIKLTRNIRKAGYPTDVIDGVGLANCRMYDGFKECWDGFSKNAYEGLGSMGLLVFLTAMHAIGHVLPWAAVPVLIALGATGIYTDAPALSLAIVAVACSVVQRLLLCGAFKLPMASALLHPVGVTLMTIIQWNSFRLEKQGKRSWRGRTLEVASSSTTETTHG